MPEIDLCESGLNFVMEKMKTEEPIDADEEESEEDEKSEIGVKRVRKSTRGKQRIPISFVCDRIRRCSTFSKRKTGLMKKAFELAELTGAEVLLLVASETNNVYTFTTNRLRAIIESDQGKQLIQSCLADGISDAVQSNVTVSASSPIQPESAEGRFRMQDGCVIQNSNDYRPPIGAADSIVVSSHQQVNPANVGNIPDISFDNCCQSLVDNRPLETNAHSISTSASTHASSIPNDMLMTFRLPDGSFIQLSPSCLNSILNSSTVS